jgi:hypothetical protein
VSTFLGPFLIDKPVSFNMDRDINTNTIADFVLEGKGPLTTTGVQATAFIPSSRVKRLGESKWPDLQWVRKRIYTLYQISFKFSFFNRSY